VPFEGKMMLLPNNAYRAAGSFDPSTHPATLDLEFVQEHWAQAQ
jgi:hypothetical protein